MALFFGCDPGLRGGFALLTAGGEIVDLWPMPLSPGRKIEASIVAQFFNVVEMTSIERLMPVHFAIERVITLPSDADRQDGRQGVLAMGVNFGIILGAAAVFHWPVDIISARTWMKVIHVGIDCQLDSKARTWTAVTRQWPHVAAQLANKSRRGFNDGVADALGIAEYARRKFN